jgi:hypothetical protein
MTSTVYCDAQFARGAGLGTRLFPWARCKVFAARHHLPMLAPRWVQLRVGPLLRGGIQLQAYHRQILLMGQFRRNGYVGGLDRARLRSAPRIDEPEQLNDASSRSNGHDGPVVMTFKGYGNLFADLEGEQEFLLQALRDETQPKWVSLADRHAAPIGVNVRCGNDFREARSESDFMTMGAVKTPVPWFVTALQAVRDAAGSAVPAVLVSDGTPEQLKDLLAMPNVHFARPGCAISDLLTLAHARVLIGSGGSSFSAWASFLSRATTFSHTGQSLQWFKIDESNRQCVTEFDPRAGLSPALIAGIRSALAGGQG